MNQCPFHLWASKDASPGGLLDYERKKGILHNGYSPFGVPDHKKYPIQGQTPLQDPVLLELATKRNVSAAVLTLAWQAQLGMVVNPRSQNAAHMLENINFLSLIGSPLTTEEMNTLNSRPQHSYFEILIQ